MDINTEEYIVIAISSDKGPESIFLRGVSKDNGKIAFVSKDTKWRSTNVKDSNGFIFALIVLNDDNGDKTSQANEVIPKMILKGKKIIIYTHLGDYLNRADIEKTISSMEGTIEEYKEFSHEPNNSNFQSLNTFYNCLNQPSFETCLKKLIEESLKKKNTPHLIALSILCQGYLAAHGGAGLDGWDRVTQDIKSKAVEKLKISDDKKNPTKKEWWKSALGKDDQSKTEEELKGILEKDDEKGNLRKLTTAIYTNGVSLPNGTLVADAYEALKGILHREQ